MREYVTELSKYGIAALMVIHTFCSFLALYEKIGKGRLVYGIQNFLMFCIQLLMFTDLALMNKELEYVFYYVFVQVLLLAVTVMVPIVYEKTDRLLLNNMCMLLGIGLCIISRLSFQKAVRQYIIVMISLAVSLFIPLILAKVRFLKKLTWAYGGVGLVLLSIVLIMGEVTRGSNLSFSVGGVTFQPSEFVKLIFIFFLAGALWDNTSFARVALTAAIAGLHVIVLVVSKDLGSALIFFVGYVFMVFAATRNYLYLLAGALGGSAAAYGAYRIFAHVQNRVIAWQNPWDYMDSVRGYAITQSLFAIGSGSWFGMGLSKGNPTAIPVVEADFIFSSLCEELGVVFGICVILATVACFLAMMKLAARIRDRFYQLIVYGAGIMYIFQSFLTIGGGTKLIPLTGVTLPFISYGGSSVMTTMMMFFIVQGIYIRLQQEGEKRHVRKTKEGQGNVGKRRTPKEKDY